MTPTAYDLADRLFQLAPWKWMPEIYLIALDDPETGQRHHISLMGMAGNHTSLALYLGPVARQRFNLIQEADFEEIPLTQEDTVALILDTPQLQCSFSERGDLYKSELAAIKKAGKKYRGENWPTFRVFRPGRSPVPADETEVRLLLTAIEQVLEVAPTLNMGDDTIRFENKTRKILTRHLLNGEWRTIWTPDDNSLYEFPSPLPSELLVEKVSRHTRPVPMEIAFTMIPSPVGKSRETSVFPYLLLVVEPASHFVLGFEMLSVGELAHDELIASIPNALLRICDKNAIRPASIAIASPATQALLAPTAAALGIRCDLKNRLPTLDDVFESMTNHLRGNF